jgi:L-fucose mutarotase/ribose pyranase (RbsD/FucU family)
VDFGFGSCPHLVDDLDVVVENGCDDRHHVGFDDTRPDVLRATHADVEDALEGQVPLPHVHHVLAPALFEDAYQTFDAAIDGENVAYACRGCGEVGEVVQRVDEREG